MKSLIISRLCLALAVCIGSITLLAAENQDLCTEERLLSYFPKDFVMMTLNKYQIPKDRWDGINRDLAEKDFEIISIVEEKASRLTPNPLRDPKERHVAVKIFRETLQESFSSVMNMHGVSDQNQIHAMLDDIQRQKAELFAQCMDKHPPRLNDQQSNPQEEGRNPDDDDDEYEWEDY